MGGKSMRVGSGQQGTLAGGAGQSCEVGKARGGALTKPTLVGRRSTVAPAPYPARSATSAGVAQPRFNGRLPSPWPKTWWVRQGLNL